MKDNKNLIIALLIGVIILGGGVLAYKWNEEKKAQQMAFVEEQNAMGEDDPVYQVPAQQTVPVVNNNVAPVVAQPVASAPANASAPKPILDRTNMADETDVVVNIYKNPSGDRLDVTYSTLDNSKVVKFKIGATTYILNQDSAFAKGADYSNSQQKAKWSTNGNNATLTLGGVSTQYTTDGKSY